MTFKPLYASNQTFTFTSMNSLSSSAYAGCLVVDNTSNLYQDALVSLIIATAGSGVSATGTVLIYAYAETDGSHYTDGVTGTDATQTPTSPTNLRQIGTASCVAASTTYYGGPFEVASAFGGVMPPKWGIVVQNSTGAALAASGSSANFTGVNTQGV